MDLSSRVVKGNSSVLILFFWIALQTSRIFFDITQVTLSFS